MRLIVKNRHDTAILEKGIFDLLKKNAPLPQQFFSLPRHKRSKYQTLEEATLKGKFDYWLTQEDIADIARLEYANFTPPNNSGIADFEIIGSLEQLITQIASFLHKAKQVDTAQHTLIINLGSAHWVTLVFYYHQGSSTAYYVNSLGQSLPEEYHSLFSKFDVTLFDLSQYFQPQQTDSYNCGLWALENAADLNQMLDEKLSINWLIERLERPRSTAYFSERRRSLSESLRTDIDRNRRLSQPHQTIAEKITITGSRRPLETPQDLGPLPKKNKVLSKEEKLSTYLQLFVREFMFNFIKRLSLYHLTAKENRISEEAFRNELKTGTTGALIGLGIAQTFAGSLPAMIASIRTLSSHYFTSKSKARKITRTLSTLAEGHLNQFLSEAGVAIFKSYESQFMQITDKAGDYVAIEKLAEDAAARALNYIAENKDPNLIISTELITYAVIFGKSEKFFDPSFKNVRIRISGSRVQDYDGKPINTANLYEKTGLVIVNPQDKSESLYRGKTADSSVYGYRRALDWEMEGGKLRSDYKTKYPLQVTLFETESQFQYFSRRYQYLNYAELPYIQQTAQDILQKIKHASHVSHETKSVINHKKGPVFFNLRKPVENFSGRKEVLLQLHHLLTGKNIGVVAQLLENLSLDSSIKEARSMPSLASVSGLGGMGKTQVALRYAQQYAAEYDNNVIWINAETKNDISLCLSKLANQLDIKIKDVYGNLKDVNELMQEIYAFFSMEKSLFIFDNVENYREFSEFFPKTIIDNTPTLLITSRYSNWKNIAPVLTIDIFTEQEAKEFIKNELSIIDDQQDTQIKELITLLQRLPLALQQAVAYIDAQRNIVSDYSISEYITQFKAKTEEFLNFDFFNYSNDPYTKTVFLAWQITLDKIKENSIVGDKALEILNIMAYIHPDHIANALFMPLEHPEKLGGAIHLLRSYSMINQQNQQDISTIHRLVQQVVRINLEKDIIAFQLIIEKLIKITTDYHKNKETELHFIHFLLYISQNDQLALALNLGYTRRRILDILIYSDYDVNIANIYDNARLIMKSDAYYLFMGESLHYLLKRGLLFFLSETLNYLEKCLVEEVLTKEDIHSIIVHRYKVAALFKGRWLVPSKIERARQLGALQLFFEFEYKIFPPVTTLCFPKRKKREIAGECFSRNIFSSKRLTPQEFIQHIQLTGRIAEFVSTGLLTKDILSELLQGKLSNVAMTLGLIGGSTLLGEISNQMLTQGKILTVTDKQLLEKNLELNGKLAFNILFDEEIIPSGKIIFLGNAIAASIVGHSASLFSNSYYLYNEIRAYQQGNAKVLPDLIANSLWIGIDGIQSGIDAAENLQLIAGISELSAPLGNAAGVAIWLTNEIVHVKKQEEWIENYVHLNWREKLWEGIRALAYYPPSDYLETKAYNNQLVQLAIAYLKNNTDIQVYIFPCAYSAKQLAIDNLVFLRNKTNIKLSASMPDFPDETKGEAELFCLSGLEESKIDKASIRWVFRPFETFYLCKHAIGVKYLQNRTGNIYLITLGEGNDRIESPLDKPTLIHINNGHKNYIGSDAGSLFILEGGAVTGMIEGGKGSNSIKFESVYIKNKFVTFLIDYNSSVCVKQNSSHSICEKGLQLKKIQNLFGVKNQMDILYIADKDIKYVDGLSGKNIFQRDEIHITNKTANNLEIILRPNTVIHCFDNPPKSTTILYRLQKDQTGEAWLHFDFIGPIFHRFYIDFSLDKLHNISVFPYAFNFNFLHEQKSFNLTLCLPLESRYNQSRSEMLKHIFYIFPNNLQIRFFNQKSLYIKDNTNRSLAENVNYYSPIAYRLKKTLHIYFEKNEMLQIAYGKHEFLFNDVLKRSHLFAHGNDALYRIISENKLNFPLPEVVLYKPSADKIYANTLDLTDIWQQAKQECSENDISLRVFQLKQDLIISIEANYYLLVTNCIRLESSWPIARIKLHGACVDNWYQYLEIILHETSLAIAASERGKWHFEKYPLVFNSNKDIIVLTEKNLEDQQTIIVLKPLNMDLYRFFCHNKTDLIFMNDWQNTNKFFDSNIIVYTNFYQNMKMREKTLKSTLIFLDREIIVQEQIEQINLAHKHCLNFSNASNTDLDKHYLVINKAANKQLENSTIRSKRDLDTQQKFSYWTTNPLTHQKKLAINNQVTHNDILFDKNKKLIASKKRIKKINFNYYRNFKKNNRIKFTRTKRNALSKKESLTSSNFSKPAINFIPVIDNATNDSLNRINQQNNESQTILHSMLINQTFSNFFNSLLLYTFFKKSSKTQKTYLFSSNETNKIDEIEERVMKALYKYRFN